MKPADPANAFFAIVNHPVKFRAFLLKKLPAALFSGVKVLEAGEDRAVVTVPYKWFTQNPFRSTYFACLAMAAEMSTGLLAMAHIYGRRPAVSILVLDIEGKFHKKAVGRTRFVCEDGHAIRQAIGEAIATGGSGSYRALSSGYNDKEELVAEFWINWTFKVRGTKNEVRA